MENQQTATPVATGNNIPRTKALGPITVDKISTAKFQKEGTLTAQIRQTVVTTSLYPSTQANRSIDDALYSNEDFGFAEKAFTNEENRVHFLNVPLGTKPEDVMSKLAAMPGACILRILSNTPILTNEQKFNISAGVTTKDVIANSQVVRFPKGHPLEGQIVLDRNGKVQYREVAFSKVAKEDLDLRTADASDTYSSPEIIAELAGASVLEGQSI